MTAESLAALHRFVAAQVLVYDRVCAELTAGVKTSHWMWFIFPQLKHLGHSVTAQHFGISSQQEALAYWRHPLLGSRLRDCSQLVVAVEGKTALEIFGFPDERKFRSSMTLFEHVAPEEPVFGQALAQYFQGERDSRTLALLR